MDDVGDPTGEVVPPGLEREMRLIREAIVMVASGGAVRVIVAGIRYGEMLLDPAREMAIEAGVQVAPLSRADGGGTDVAVERIEAA